MLLAALLIAGSASCGAATGQSGPPGAPPAPAQKAVLTWARGDWPVELQRDPDWQAASRGEEWALLRLGERRAQLLRVVEVGGPAALVALRAWPNARLAWQERGALCRVMPRYASTDWAPLLRALQQSAPTEEAFGEILDPEADVSCERAIELTEQQIPKLSAEAFDEYTATCQAFGREPRSRSQ